MSRGHEMYCHDLGVMGSNLSRVELGLELLSSASTMNQKYVDYIFSYLTVWSLCIFLFIHLFIV